MNMMKLNVLFLSKRCGCFCCSFSVIYHNMNFSNIDKINLTKLFNLVTFCAVCLNFLKLISIIIFYSIFIVQEILKLWYSVLGNNRYNHVYNLLKVVWQVSILCL